ncbi:hypothetical protein RUND412_003262 [Rhizina undulata]
MSRRPSNAPIAKSHHVLLQASPTPSLATTPTPHAGSMHLNIPTLFYSTSFTIISILLFLLLLVTPGDAIAQALLRNRQLYNVFVIAGTYVLTLILALTIYTTRLFSIRRVLAEIPKHYVPVKKLDLPKRVHRAVADNLSLSAIIATTSRPADTAGDGGVWGRIQHPGWSPPGVEDGWRNVRYREVIQELPHLIETKATETHAMARTPSSPRFFGNVDEDMLVRQPSMTLRSYLANLAQLGIVKSPAAEAFVPRYEKARFSPRELEESEFRELMRVFAVLLHGMGPPEELRVETDSWSARDDDAGIRDSYPYSFEQRFDAFGYGTGTDYDGGYTTERVDTGEESTDFTAVGMERGDTTRTGESLVSGDTGESFEMDILDEVPRRWRKSVRSSTGTFG